MADKLLDRFMHRMHPHGANENVAPEETEIEDFGVFGFLRGSKERAPMLELRKRDGRILAVAYGTFELEFNPSEGITLNFVDKKVHIKGRNLNAEAKPNIRLFESLARNRVPWLREMSEPELMKTQPNATVIDAIEWQ